MLTRFGLLILIATAVMAAQCDRKKAVSISEACETAFKLFYRDGRFTLTGEEYDALRPVNQVKITDFKVWFKSECPAQYANTAGGKKKP